MYERIVFVINSKISHFVIEYINSLIINENISYITHLDNEDIILENIYTTKYIFICTTINNAFRILNYNNNKNIIDFSKVTIGLLNMEQLSYSDNIHKLMNTYETLSNSFNNITINIYDYAIGNINTLKSHNINAYLLPYHYNKNEVNKLKEYLNVNKEYDICFCGWTNGDHRLDLLKKIKLETNYKLFTVNQIYNDKRDEDIGKCKILLNIHRLNEYNIFESIRCNRWVYSNMCVISENSEDMLENTLSKYIVWSDYNNIIETIHKVLNNYNEYINYNIDENIIINNSKMIYNNLFNI